MINLLITILVVALILGIFFWAFQKIPLPEPFRWIVYVVIAIVALLFLVSFLGDGSLGGPYHFGFRR